MSVYFIAQIKITDTKAYDRYLQSCDAVFAKYNGTYLAVDSNPIILEGSWDYSRSIIIEFPTEKDFDSWYHSEDYQQILVHRLKGAICNTLLVHGK